MGLSATVSHRFVGNCSRLCLLINIYITTLYATIVESHSYAVLCGAEETKSHEYFQRLPDGCTTLKINVDLAVATQRVIARMASVYIINKKQE